MELDPWLTSPDSPEKRATGREGGRHCKRSALKVAEESNGCTSLPRFKSCRVNSNTANSPKHRKPGSRVGKFYSCQLQFLSSWEILPIQKKHPLPFVSFWLFPLAPPKKNTTRPAGETTISRCCQVSESRPGTPGFLSSKSHPAWWRFRGANVSKLETFGGYGSVPDFYTIYIRTINIYIIYTYIIYIWLYKPIIVHIC